MTQATFLHAQVKGIVTVIPERVISLDDETEFYKNDPEKLDKLKKVVGLNTRRVVNNKTTPADLCEQAAYHLLTEMNVNKEEIDALICVLDYPDYRIPPTACVLQGKLDLPKTCMAFDISHGCAGYVYGLFVASSMIESGACKKILLLVGDTKSRTINIKDRISAPLFGDGAAATLIEYSSEQTPSAYVLGTEGKLFENILIPAGGARLPCSLETSQEKKDEFGNIRSQENFTMNGKAVFDFTMNNVPKNIKELLNMTNLSSQEIDYLVLHQANKSIITNIAMRVGFKNMGKVPTKTLEKFGNLSVASIPSVLNDQLGSVLSEEKAQILISGFGVGLAYGSAVINLNKIYCPQPFFYKE